jgi:hypothetical protein
MAIGINLNDDDGWYRDGDAEEDLKRGKPTTIHPDVTLELVLEALEADDCTGYCIGCGAQASNIEPDARNYECECCEALMVFGAEELLLMLG